MNSRQIAVVLAIAILVIAIISTILVLTLQTPVAVAPTDMVLSATSSVVSSASATVASTSEPTATETSSPPTQTPQINTTPHLLGQTPEEVKQFIEEAPDTVGGLKLLNFPDQNEPHTPVMAFVNTDGVKYQFRIYFDPSITSIDEAIERVKSYATEVKVIDLADNTVLLRGASSLALMRYQNVLINIYLPDESYNRPDVKATAVPLSDEQLIAVLSDIYHYLTLQ